MFGDRYIRESAARLNSRAAVLLALAVLLLPGGSLLAGGYWLYAWVNSRMSKPE